MTPVPIGTARQWIHEYTACYSSRYGEKLSYHLRRYQAAYERVHPGCSFIDSMDRTDFIRDWLPTESSPDFRQFWLTSMRGLADKMLMQGRVDANVLHYISRADVTDLTVPEIWLRRSLQPAILIYIQSLRATGDRRCERYLTAAHEWNLFRNRPENEQWSRPELVTDCWLGWIDTMCRRGRSFSWTQGYLRGLDHFFDFLVSQGILTENLFSEFRRKLTFNARTHKTLAQLLQPSYEELHAILVGADTVGLSSLTVFPDIPKVLLKRLPARQATLVKALPEWMEHYLEFLQSRGRKAGQRSNYQNHLQILAGVLQRHTIESLESLTADAVREYLTIKCNKNFNPGCPLSSNTARGRLTTLRGLCRYSHRRGVKVPLDMVESWPRLKLADFRPHIFTLKEVNALLEAFGRRAITRSFIWRSCQVMVYLLYACGLRSGETRRLNLGEVDFGSQRLLVARTKFYKERWVPLAEGAIRRLRSYRFLRNQYFPEVVGADSPFFLNSSGRRISENLFADRFRSIIDELAIQSRGDRAPRAHDLRHTMAVHRVYKWYSDGADVQNKLPLLATYLGHSCYLHTETYLHLTTDLIRQAGRSFEASFEQIIGEVVRGTENS